MVQLPKLPSHLRNGTSSAREAVAPVALLFHTLDSGSVCRSEIFSGDGATASQMFAPLFAVPYHFVQLVNWFRNLLLPSVTFPLFSTHGTLLRFVKANLEDK